MRNHSFSILFGMVLAFPFSSMNARIGDPVIISPRPGDVLQGAVSISGSSDVSGFVSAEISFSYTDDPTGTWFLISTNTQAVFGNTLAIWDTTIITDGNYNLRLRVYLVDRSFRDAQVSNLRIRNYSPVETPTPVPPAPEDTLIPTYTPTATPYPTPTILSRNPGTLASTDVSSSLILGGITAILILLIFSFYLWLKRK